MDLYIHTRGTYVHVKDEMFEVRVPTGDRASPYEPRHFAAKKVRAIHLPKSAALSTDAVFLALQFHIDILFVDYDGRPQGRVWHSRLGSTTRIRKAQLEASTSAAGLWWVRQWVGEKLERQINWLKRMRKSREPLHEAFDACTGRMEALRADILALEGYAADVGDTLRGKEGVSGRLYFQMLSAAIPKKHRFEGRSMRPAQDTFNAFLNYGYGMLYGRVEKALMVAGLDPYVGFLHRDDYNQTSMVFDFIEPYRPWVDEAVFKLFSGKAVRDDHSEAITGGVALGPEGKPLVVEAMNTAFDQERIRYRGRNLTRGHALQLDAHQFANHLIGKTDEASKEEAIL
jgi:CRISPR-associated protein Cas1